MKPQQTFSKLVESYIRQSHPNLILPHFTIEPCMPFVMRTLCTIVITTADKGRTMVLLNKEEYIRKMEAIIGDETKYCVVKRYPNTRMENRIMDALK